MAELLTPEARARLEPIVAKASPGVRADYELLISHANLASDAAKRCDAQAAESSLAAFKAASSRLVYGSYRDFIVGTLQPAEFRELSYRIGEFSSLLERHVKTELQKCR